MILTQLSELELYKRHLFEAELRELAFRRNLDLTLCDKATLDALYQEVRDNWDKRADE